MNGTATGTRLEDRITSFFSGLDAYGELLGAITDGGLSAVLEFRGSGKRVSLDVSSASVVTRTGGFDIRGAATVAGTPEELDDMLLGRLSVLNGLLERRLLLRGGMCHIVAVLPILGLVPVLYGDFTDRLEKRPGRVRKFFGGVIDKLSRLPALLAGRLVFRLDGQSRLIVMNAFAAGARRFSAIPVAEPRGSRNLKDDSHPLDQPPPPALQAILLSSLSFVFYSAGWFLSVMKHRLELPVGMAGILKDVSDGIGGARAAASGKPASAPETAETGAEAVRESSVNDRLIIRSSGEEDRKQGTITRAVSLSGSGGSKR